MIKYVINNDRGISYDTDTEDLGVMKCSYFGDFWLVEKDGELTIHHRDGSKRVMPVVEGDIVTSMWAKGQQNWIIVKDANLTELVKERIYENLQPVCDACDNVKSVA